MGTRERHEFSPQLEAPSQGIRALQHAAAPFAVAANAHRDTQIGDRLKVIEGGARPQLARPKKVADGDSR